MFLHEYGFHRLLTLICTGFRDFYKTYWIVCSNNVYVNAYSSPSLMNGFRLNLVLWDLH